MNASSRIKLSAVETVHEIRWRPLSPRSISPPEDNFCLSIAKSPLVHLQVLSSFASSSVSSSSSCLSGPGGWMSHCYESISAMLFAVPNGLSAGLSQCLPAVFYLLTACLLLYLPAFGLFHWCHICSVCWWKDAHFLCLVSSPTHQTVLEFFRNYSLVLVCSHLKRHGSLVQTVEWCFPPCFAVAGCKNYTHSHPRTHTST